MYRVALMLAALALAVASTGCRSGKCCQGQSIAEPSHPYRHVVAFKFKPDVTEAEINEVNRAFAELPQEIDVIRAFEWGTNVSPEGHDQGFTHCYLVTFDDKAGLEVYLPHPAHKEFVAMIGPKLEKVFVVDYVAR